MTLQADLAQRVQSSQPGKIIYLYDIDPRPIDPSATVLHFYPGSKESNIEGLGSVMWRGNEYVPYALEIEGIDTSVSGSLPRPILRIANVFGLVSAFIKQYGRVGGAILTRWQTFTDYLDDGDNPTPDGYMPVDVYILDRISKDQSPLITEIECRSLLDYSRRKLPGRKILRTACTHTYRVPDGAGGFDYTNVTCPYVGTTYFDAQNQSTTAANDRCSKMLSGCRLRFGSNPIPIRAFPGVGRFG